MSKPRIELNLLVDTQGHANTIINNLRTQLQGKEIFETHVFDSIASTDGVWIRGSWRFNKQLDRDNVKEWIRDKIQDNPQVKDWILKAELSWHICTHDDAEVRNCNEMQFGKIIK